MSHEALIARINELPRIESVLQELLQMVNRENIDFGELARKMSMEQVLSARVLRMANSSYFGGVKGISTINDAIIRVGTGAIRSLVSSSILATTFANLDTLNLKDYWANTFEVAMIASSLARPAKVDPNQTFTTGVLHNIGELMIHALEPEKALQIKQCIDQGQQPVQAQRDILATDASSLGAALAEEWQFPADMIDAIANINHPAKASESKRLACVLYLARDIHARWDSIFEIKAKRDYLEHHPAARALKLSPDLAESIDQVRGQGSAMAYQLF